MKKFYNLGSDQPCANTQPDLDLYCLHVIKGTFSCNLVHILTNKDLIKFSLTGVGCKVVLTPVYCYILLLFKSLQNSYWFCEIRRKDSI